MNVEKYIPFSISPNDQNVRSEDLFAVGTNPDVQGIERDNDYPIIVVPGMMGSRLFDSKNRRI